MKSRIFNLCLAAVTGLLVLSACDSGNDDPIIQPASKNANANPTTFYTAQEVTRTEFPHIAGGTDNLIIVHKVSGFGRDGVNYSIEWDCQEKAQRWTCYQMHAGNSAENWKRSQWNSTPWKGDPFQEDKDIPAEYRTTLDDYRGSGYDRGHICPSADRLYSQDVNEQTFYMSNMHPQKHNFNAGIWEDMEGQVRKWNTNTFRDTLFVCKGGTINEQLGQVLTRTKSGVIVPKYFFMAILCKKNGSYKAMAFWAEHTDKKASGAKLADYAISIDELEKKTGIDFFCNLPDDVEDRVEAVDPKSDAAKTAWRLNDN